jgi:hypothetical protein
MTQVAEQKTAEEIAAEEAESLKLAEEQKAEEEALKSFNEGFTDTPAETAKPTEEEITAAEEAAKADADRLAAEEAAAKAAEPVYAKPTQQEFLDLVSKANSVGEIRALVEKVRDTAQGRVGNLEQMIRKLQEATPVGQAIAVTVEDFAEIHKDMPEHAKMLADGLTRVLSKFKGTATPVPTETPEEFAERVNRIADQRIAEREAARLKVIQDEARADLAIVHPDWETVVGPKDSSTEFRKYLKTQPGLYEKRILSTNEADVLSEALTKFKTEQEKKKPKTPVTPSAREERLREAVQVRGGATPPNKNRTKSPDEEFAEGFNS